MPGFLSPSSSLLVPSSAAGTGSEGERSRRGMVGSLPTSHWPDGTGPGEHDDGRNHAEEEDDDDDVCSSSDDHDPEDDDNEDDDDDEDVLDGFDFAAASRLAARLATTPSSVMPQQQPARRRHHHVAAPPTRHLPAMLKDRPKLQFQLQHCDGGEYGTKYLAKNVLVEDASVYCSVHHRNVNLSFRYAPDPDGHSLASFHLSHLLIQSPLIGYTAPCREGLVFVSEEPLTDTLVYNDFSLAKYCTWLRQELEQAQRQLEDRENEPPARDERKPVAFFRMTADSQYQVAVDFVSRRTPQDYTRMLNELSAEGQLALVHPQQAGKPVRGRHVLLKLLSSDHHSPSILGGPAEGNIDLQYVGFFGTSGKRSFPFATMN